MSWAVERSTGPAGELHGRELPADPVRAVWRLEAESPAIALGSTQALDTVRPDTGLEVVRRRSGGGAVLIVPGDLLWLDVIVPRGDPLWDDDVARATWWLGRTWRTALEACGVGATVHTGPMVRTRWSSLVCFAGVGPGEVMVGGAKAVGISQRRTRAAARFQCAVHRRWDPARLVASLAVPRPTAGELAGCAVEVAVALDDLEAAFLAALPAR